MGYCSVDDLKRILPENVKIGDSNIGTPVPGRIGNQGSNRSNISPEEAERYILYADQYIDGRLRPFYVCPLRRIKSFEDEIQSNIVPGTRVTVTLHDSGAFIRGDMVRLQDKSKMETCNVLETPTIYTVVLDRVLGSYNTVNGSKISVLEYPDPVPLTVARLACSFILDRLFVAEQAPDVSTYGKTQRNLANTAINDILMGIVLLFGQEHTGRRFVRGSLIEPFKSPAEIQKVDEKE